MRRSTALELNGLPSFLQLGSLNCPKHLEHLQRPSKPHRLLINGAMFFPISGLCIDIVIAQRGFRLAADLHKLGEVGR